MTIDNLEVNLSDCFAYGQVYNALSRATTLIKLSIKCINPKKIKTNKKVLEYI